MKSTIQILLIVTVIVFASPVSACISSEVEVNDTLTNANGPICNQRLISGKIDNRSDEDWFYFDASSGNFSASINHQRRDDFDWILYDHDGTRLASAESSSIPDSYTFQLANDGRYYLRVLRYRGTGWYELTLDFSQPDGGANDPCDTGNRPAKPATLTSWRVNRSAQDDVCPQLAEGGVLLMGGNFDVDEAFSTRVKPLVNGGDVVVLRTTGTDAYNQVLFDRIGADSVETIILDSRNKADSDYVDWVIRTAEFVWIAGGDQADYLNQWKGTKTESALNSVIAKGGVIGGTSAGNAVQGQFVYDPDGVAGIYSSEAVTDACHPYLNISSFLDNPSMRNIVTDTHFSQRDRMGRLAVFMADIGSPITGIGVDEDTSFFIHANGQSVVDGDNAVYILEEDGNSNLAQFSCGDPVIYRNLRRYKLGAGDTFDFSTGISSASYIYLDIDGRNNNFYTPISPY